MPHVIAGIRIPDDDTMWSLYLHTSARALASLLEIDHSGLSRHLKERGWVRGGSSWRVRVAPCRECGGRLRVNRRTRYRLCADCRKRPDIDPGPRAAWPSLPDEPLAPLPPEYRQEAA